LQEVFHNVKIEDCPILIAAAQAAEYDPALY